MNWNHRNAFTVIELLIVVVILGILAAVVIPQFSDAATDAKNSRVKADLTTVRRAIGRYITDHDRLPNQLPDRSPDPDANNFVLRLTSRTNPSGILNPVGKCGPYLPKMPSNPFTADSTKSNQTQLGTASPPNGSAGWYFNTSTGVFSANTSGQENF